MSQKFVFVHIAMPGRLSGDFSDYMPWHHGGYSDKLHYTSAEGMDGSNQYRVGHVFDLTDKEQWSPEDLSAFLEPVIEDLYRDSRQFNYYRFFGSENSAWWLKAQEYLDVLNVKISQLTAVNHPYALWLERLRDDVQRHVTQILGHDGTSKIGFQITPLMTIPKTRYDEFLGQRHTQKGQRFGQAFFNFMDAHKCTQDKAWWDRLYQADDMLARGMINPLIDWEN